ncbi:MAG TPA: sulfatase [Planctomycetota bacterium]
MSNSSRALAALLAGTLFVPACGDEPPRVNVVLISIDSLRQDHLGCYGHKAEFAPDLPVSPNIDALAAVGVLFGEAWSTSSWTLPAHMSIFTGLDDAAHGVSADDFRLDPLRATLPEELADAGYTTGGFYSGPYLDPKYGFGRGFDSYTSAMASAAGIAAEIARLNAERTAQGGQPLAPAEVAAFRDRLSHRDVTSPRVNELGLEFLAEHAGKEPFFLFLHYFDVHYDYTPPAELAAAFDPDYSGWLDGSNWYFDPRVWDRENRRPVLSQRDLRHALALYDAEIHWVDRHVGAVVQALKDAGVWDDTLLVLTADHGDEFFERGGIGHRSTLYAEQLRVPLVLKLPAGDRAGARPAALARAYDLAPTILDYAGYGALPEARGRSLRTAIEGGGEAKVSALGRIVAGPQPIDAWRDERFTVIRPLEFDRQALLRERRLVSRPLEDAGGRPVFEVYDRDADPRELGPPLAPDDPGRQAAIDAFCRDFAAARDQDLRMLISPLADRYAPDKTDEEAATLAALGYVGGNEPSGGQRRFPPIAPFPSPCRR